MTNRSAFHVHPNRMFVDQTASQIAGKGNQYSGNAGQVKAPEHELFTPLIPHHPVERSQGQHHYGQNGMAPCCNTSAYIRHGSNVDQSGDTGYPTTRSPYTCQPQSGSCPELIARPPEAEIGTHQCDQRRDGKVNQHGMNRVARYGGAAFDVVGRRHAGLSSRWQTFKWTAWGLTVPLVGCSGTQSMLDPYGPAARAVAWTWWAMFGFSAVVLVGVVALWLIGMRRPPAAVPEEKVARYNRRWIVWGGIVLPCVSIVLLLSFGIPQGKRMLPLPVEGVQPLKVEVIGHQWWWEVRYPESGVVTANQMNLPAGRPLDIHVSSADVIHSFWIPRLGGKIDMIPGRTNVIRLEADRLATHRGQCSEFCGMQHTHMILYSEVQTAEDFATWLKARQQWQAPAPQPEARSLFERECAACHQVSGLESPLGGITDETLLIGPDLGDVGSRSHLGAGVLKNEPGAIRRWLSEHQTLKPENRMPPLDHLRDTELDVLADWLETLTP